MTAQTIVSTATITVYGPDSAILDIFGVDLGVPSPDNLDDVEFFDANGVYVKSTQVTTEVGHTSMVTTPDESSAAHIERFDDFVGDRIADIRKGLVGGGQNRATIELTYDELMRIRNRIADATQEEPIFIVNDENGRQVRRFDGGEDAS